MSSYCCRNIRARMKARFVIREHLIREMDGDREVKAQEAGAAPSSRAGRCARPGSDGVALSAGAQRRRSLRYAASRSPEPLDGCSVWIRRDQVTLGISGYRHRQAYAGPRFRLRNYTSEMARLMKKRALCARPSTAEKPWSYGCAWEE